MGILLSKKHNSDINKFGQFTITDIKDGKYWYNDRVICDISEQYEWELVEQKPQRMVSAEAKEALYDKLAWSEEDETAVDVLINLVKMPYGNYIDFSAKNRLLNWLIALKGRIAQCRK